MGIWLDALEKKAGMIHGQLAAAQVLAKEHGMDEVAISAPYFELLHQLYRDDFEFVNIADSSDLIARYKGPTPPNGGQATSIVASAFAEIWQEVQGIAKSMAGLDDSYPIAWPAELEPGLTGIKQDSLVFGISIPLPSEGNVPCDQVAEPDVASRAYEYARAAAMSLTAVGKYIGQDSISEKIQEEFPNPVVRNRIVAAASRLAPTGNNGIDSVTLFEVKQQIDVPVALTPNSREVLQRFLDESVAANKIKAV
ncbi:MAG: hypothetical protein ACR2PJ_07090 [Pseudomonadales bacterium]